MFSEAAWELVISSIIIIVVFSMAICSPTSFAFWYVGSSCSWALCMAHLRRATLSAQSRSLSFCSGNSMLFDLGEDVWWRQTGLGYFALRSRSQLQSVQALEHRLAELLCLCEIHLRVVDLKLLCWMSCRRLLLWLRQLYRERQPGAELQHHAAVYGIEWLFGVYKCNKWG